VVTEDVVFLAESLGFDTGIDLEKLLEVRKIVAQALPARRCMGRPQGRIAEGLRLCGTAPGGVEFVSLIPAKAGIQYLAKNWMPAVRGHERNVGGCA
jgi:hypothetical protein